MPTPEEMVAAATAEANALKAQRAEQARINEANTKAIAELTSKQSAVSQEQAVLALKAKCPDVPEATLRALPPEAREAQALMLQESFGKLKTASAVKTGPDAWANLGGIGPSIEAEDAAQLAARTAARDAAVQKGNVMDVLRIKSRDIVEFVQKNYPLR